MEASTSTDSFNRRVSFNEDTISPPNERRREYRAGDIEKRTCVNREHCRDCFCYSFLVLAMIVFLGSLIHVILLQWEMPKVRIQRINVSSVNSTAAADLIVFLNATNGGKNTQLIYSKMIASVTASGVRFGVARLTGFRQPPWSSTVLEVEVVMEDQAEAAARDLRSKSEAQALVLDVYVKGWMNAIHRGKKMNERLPFQIECRNIKQSEIDAGRSLPCRNQMFESGCEFLKSRAPGFECQVGPQVDPLCNRPRAP